MNKREIFIDIVFTKKTILEKIHYSKTSPNITKLPVNYSRDTWHVIQSFQLPSTSNNPKESILGVNESLLARQPTSWCKDLLGKFDTLWEKETSIKERATKIKKKDKKKIYTLYWIQIYAPPVEWSNHRYPPRKNARFKYSASIDFTIWWRLSRQETSRSSQTRTCVAHVQSRDD